jgi:hypothetical protein
MNHSEIYELLWEIFTPFERGLDMDRRVALDSCIDTASRRLAGSCEVRLAVSDVAIDRKER